MWSPIKVTRYLYLLAVNNFDLFDQLIDNEKKLSLKLYFLFQKNFQVNNHEKSFDYLLTALENNCAHLNSINIFVKSCLPILLVEKEYEIVESMAIKLLSFNFLKSDNKLALYHALGNSLYHQNKNEELAELVNRIEFVEKRTDDYFVKWYRDGMKKI